MIKFIIEKTIKEEKETFIYIDKFCKTCCLYTTDSVVFKRIQKKIGNPTKTYPPTSNTKNNSIISGASWTYHYDKSDEREKVRKMFNMTTFIPRISDFD